MIIQKSQRKLLKKGEDFDNLPETYVVFITENDLMGKESKEGIAVMCKAMEDMRNESLQEGMQEAMKAAALRMLKVGKYALEEIAAISGLSLDEVKKLNANKTA